MFQDKLQELGACGESLFWVGDMSLDEAWYSCKRADWMAWLVARLLPKITSGPVVCACARTALKYVPDVESRPRIAIETAEAYVRGEATLEEVCVAGRNAHLTYSAAAAATAYAYAASAADASAAAAAYAYAASAADASAAAVAAAVAADAIAAASARRVAHLKQCEIIRSMVSIEQIKEGL